MKTEPEWRFLRRVANETVADRADRKRLRAMAVAAHRQAKRDTGLEGCERCGKWRPLETMTAIEEGGYLCALCVKEMVNEPPAGQSAMSGGTT